MGLHVFGLRTIALMEALVNPLTRLPRPPQLPQQGASRTLPQIHVSHEEHTRIQRKLVLNWGQLVANSKSASTMPCPMAQRHVARPTPQQPWARVCRALTRTNASLSVHPTAQTRRVAFSWELKVATMLHAVGSMVIANHLHLLTTISWSWSDVLSSFCFCVGDLFC